MAYMDDYKTWMQKQEKITMTQSFLKVVSNMQQVSMLGMQLLCDIQVNMAWQKNADEVHMAQILQVQELINLD